jgi:hypothetical protein
MKTILTYGEFINENLNEAKKEKFILYTNPNNSTNAAYVAIGAADVRRVLSSAKTYSDSYRILYQGSGTQDDLIKAKQMFSNYRFGNESIDESRLNESLGDPIRDIHFETDPNRQEKLKIAYGKSTGAVGNTAKIDDADYMLKKFRKEIGFGDGSYTGVFLPYSYDAIHSKLGNGPHAKAKRPSIRWNEREYAKWVRDNASMGGAQHSFDMAQNAKHEPGLIDYVKKNNPGEDPLEVIQWAIQAYA